MVGDGVTKAVLGGWAFWEVLGRAIMMVGGHFELSVGSTTMAVGDKILHVTSLWVYAGGKCRYLMHRKLECFELP